MSPTSYRTAPPRAISSLSLVGLGRFELPTSRLSGVRSNQLSYRPIALLRPFLPQKRATLHFSAGPLSTVDALKGPCSFGGYLKTACDLLNANYERTESLLDSIPEN